MCIDIMEGFISFKTGRRALKLTSKDLLKLGVIDKIIYEPIGGAQSDPQRIIRIVRAFLLSTIKSFQQNDRG